MRPMHIGALALFLTLAGGSVAAERIKIIETRSLRNAWPPTAGTPWQTLRLHVYGFRGTRWDPDDVVKATVHAAHFLAQCGIVLSAAELRIVDAPRRFHFYFTPVSRELLRTIGAAKPALFFVEDTRNDPGFDAETIGRANAASRPELTDTIWIAHGARDLPLAIAHELVHLLADSGEHSREPGNLMRAETGAENVKLSPAQCERVRSRGEANGLLRPAGLAGG